MMRNAPPFRIRRAVPADAAALAELGERTFRETFAPNNTPEDLALHLAATYSPARQAAELADPAHTILVAEDGAGGLIGFAQLREGPAPAVVRGPAPIELLRFYVDRVYHGRGVASALMAATLAAAAGRLAGTIWLGVWERNPRAIGFLSEVGVRGSGEPGFPAGYGPAEGPGDGAGDWAGGVGAAEPLPGARAGQTRISAARYPRSL